MSNLPNFRVFWIENVLIHRKGHNPQNKSKQQCTFFLWNNKRIVTINKNNQQLTDKDTYCRYKIHFIICTHKSTNMFCSLVVLRIRKKTKINDIVKFWLSNVFLF